MAAKPGARPDVKKISGELFVLTYGALVAQLVRDFEDDELVNKQLEKMGFNIGVRLIDDFLANSGVTRCQDFHETVDVICKVGFKMFLGVVPTATKWTADGKSCVLVLDENPLATFVELPDAHPQLCYSNLLCGVLRGALEMVQLKVEVSFLKDVLRGDDSTEIRLHLVETLADEAPPSDE